ncbi:serine/threonine protein kinase [Streptomyces sp. CS081A]|uniref:serine/threonine protein kinase n=1 Tax=Streptomyces sp. CS081A TaxID=2162709 RepID=UPI001EF59CA2|nr:serine/threonine protein kinase [Streptomyces sp. CS081A]
MEPLRHDDPPWAGSHVLLGRLDADSERAVPVRRFVARSADGDRDLLVSLPRPDADPARWAVEAEGARRLSLPGFLPVTEVGGTAELPWCATPYVPALPLPAALRAHGGPLPEPFVRFLGAALARALATAHARGVTHAGLSPAAVLLTTDGPRASCFGAVRAAGPDGERRDGPPGLDPGCLAPEQAAGGRPRPLGDVYALGAVLAHAATGHTAPERDEIPVPLRSLVTACLSRDPATRPQAHQVLALLEPNTRWEPVAHPVAGPRPRGAHPATVLDAPPHPATVLDGADGPGPLPALVVAALARQAARVLAAELPAPAPGHPAPGSPRPTALD